MTDPMFAGMNPTNIAAKLKKTLDSPPVDLKEIVHQELGLAQAHSKLQGYRDAGIRFYRVLSAGDDHVCAYCRKLENGGPYSVDAETLPGYPHCKKCRCTIVAISP